VGEANEIVAELADELRSLWRLRWDRPNDFGDFSRQPKLANLLELSGGRRDVDRLRERLAQITEEVRVEEETVPRENDRSLAYAWTAYLKLEEKWEGTQLQERQYHICKEWRTSYGTLVTSPASVKEHCEPEIYSELARRLLGERADAPAPRRRRKPPRPSRRAVPSWPRAGREPSAGQDVLILIAANAKRRGPNSGLVKLVREFERYWRTTKTFIYSLEGSHREIWRAGLLHDYEDFVALPAGFYGGLLYATEAVVAAAEAESDCHVVYLVDPHDNSSLYPATASIKRQCILNQTPFSSTYQGAARWLRLEWARRASEGKGSGQGQELLVAPPPGGFGQGSDLTEQPGVLALAAHDRHKRAIMDLVDEHADLLTNYFPERWSTQVTGHLLNGGSIEDEEYANDILYDVKEEDREEVERRIEEKAEEWREERRTDGPGTTGWATQLTRGRQGGVIQLARRVLDDECDTVLFLEDAETPGDQDMEIQVLDRAAQLADGDCLLLYDERSGDRWAQNLTLCAEEGGGASAMTLTEAYRRVFDVELILVEPDLKPGQRTKGRRKVKEADRRRTWKRIAATAAVHVLGVLKTASREREGSKPVRLGIPWGGTIGDVIGELPDARDRNGLMGAIGLRRFVDDKPEATLLHGSRKHEISEETWPPLAKEHLPPFGPDELRVVPVVGVMGAQRRSVESHSLVGRAVKILGGKPVPHPAPAFALIRGEGEPRDAAPNEDWEELDVLLINAAPLLERPKDENEGPAALATGLPKDLADDYEDCICAIGTFYLEEADDEIKERAHDSYTHLGISMEQVRRLKEKGAEVVLANGADYRAARRRAAWAALNADLVSTFVTDEKFAWEVLNEQIPELKPPG
jgi:methylglyoxal synthase